MSEPSRSFYASPAEATAAPAEEFLYVACLHEGTGVDEPDFLAVVDAEDGQIVHRLPMPNVGDELHHFGWNRCSSACHGPDRSHLIVPGFRSSRIHVVNVADDPRRPRIEKVIEPDELVRATGLTRPHTVHCMPGEQHRHQHARRRRRQRRVRLRRPRRADVRGQGPLGERRAPPAAQLRLLVPAAPERARLVGVRRAERLRERVRSRGRRRRPLRQPPAFLEPERAPRRADARARRDRARAAGDPLAPRSRRRPGLRRRRALEHDVALPPRQRLLPRRPGDRRRRRRAGGLAVPGPRADHRPRRLDGRPLPVLLELAARRPAPVRHLRPGEPAAHRRSSSSAACSAGRPTPAASSTAARRCSSSRSTGAGSTSPTRSTRPGTTSSIPGCARGCCA